MSTRIQFCVALVICFCSINIAAVLGQEKKPKEIKIPVEMKPFKMTVVDEADKPVKGVKVTAIGVRCEESPGSWIGWPVENGGNNEFLTDENGVIEMKYPVKMGRPGQWMKLNKIDFVFNHPDYVAGRVEVDPQNEKAQHGLIQGCRTLFTCVDENGMPVKKFGVQMAGTGAEATWKLDDGEVRSSGVPDGKWQTMLVAPSPDGLHRFSGILPARYAKGKDVTIRGIKLRPGMRLSGSLSENVPRPIEDGIVIAWCLPKPVGNTWGDVDASIGWSEETTIAANGSFEFPSLPPGGIIQLIALSKGWLIDGIENGRMKGIEIKVDENQVAENRVTGVTLQMKEAGQLEVEVVGPDGKPLAGADVSTWPNQLMTLGGSTLLGTCYKSISSVESQITGDNYAEVDWQRPGRYIQKTNEQGKAILREIPLGHGYQIFVGYEKLTAKLDKPVANVFENSVPYKCDSPELKKMTIQMVPIEE